jgi:hypothetical protein
VCRGRRNEAEADQSNDGQKAVFEKVFHFLLRFF